MKKISFLRKIRRRIKDKLPKSLRDYIDSKNFFLGDLMITNYTFL